MTSGLRERCSPGMWLWPRARCPMWKPVGGVWPRVSSRRRAATRPSRVTSPSVRPTNHGANDEGSKLRMRRLTGPLRPPRYRLRDPGDLWLADSAVNARVSPAHPRARPQRRRPWLPSLLSGSQHLPNATAPAEFLATGGSQLKSPGFYSWCIDTTGAADLEAGLGQPGPQGLIYAGMAGATRSRSGRKSTNTLRGRIRGMHLGGRHHYADSLPEAALSLLRRWVGARYEKPSGA
jgi:hypothetical protein